MTAALSEPDDLLAAPTLLPAGERARLLVWGGLIVLLTNLSAPGAGLLGLPITFFLKNRLHLSAHALAVFNLWTGAPLYVAFVFGFLRDRWSPFGRGDRGHMILFGLAAAAVYAALAFAPPSRTVLGAGIVVVTMTLLMVGSAAAGLVSAIGKQHAMAGQASSAVNIALLLPAAIAALCGGLLSQALEGAGAIAAARALFLIAAGLMVLIALFGAAGPRALFAAARDERSELPAASDFARLLRSGPVWLALAIQLLWQFGPASGVVLQYHLQNALHATDSQVGAFYSIFYVSFLPPFFAYGWLCRRVRLSTLLWVSTVIAVLQWAPILFVRSAEGALALAVPIALMGGLASAAYLDLAIRVCPAGLQGAMMMLITTTAYWISLRFGDLLGTALYERPGGFAAAVWATIAVYALILPLLPLIPRRLTAMADGVAIPEPAC